MAIIYTYPEINQVEGEDLLLISDTSLYKRPTRSVTIDNLAAYVGTVIGIGFWNLGTAPDSIFTTKMASIGQDANIASSKLNVYKTDDMTASVPHVATFNESSSNHSLNLWPSPGNNSADIYGSVSRGTFTGSGTVDQIKGIESIGRHSGSGSVNIIQGTHAAASLTGAGSVKTIAASYAKTFIEGTGSNNIENAFGAWNVVELDGLNDVDTIYGTYSNVVLTNGEVNDDAIGHFIGFDQVSADTEINNAYYIHAINNSLSVTGEKFFIKDETGIPSQFSNKLVLNAYGSGTFTGTATQRLAVDTNGNVIEIPIGSGPVDGSGTANYTARWIDTDTLGIGALYDNGTNVGIGTTSPDYLFEVEKTTSGSATLASFKNTENTGIRISRTGASPGTSVFNVVNNGALYTSSDSHIAFQPGNSTSVFMQSTGNVGIGTTSPSEKLEVRGNVYIEGSFPYIKLKQDTSGLQEYSIINNGNFTIEKTTSASGGSFLIKDENGRTPLNVSMGLLNPDTVISGDLFVKDKDGLTTKLYVDNGSGNVGIGTTSPASILHLKSDTSTLTLESSDTTLNPDQVWASLDFKQNDGSQTPVGSVANISAVAKAGNTNFGNLLFQTKSRPADTYNDTLFLSSSGNVGIGTTSPSTNLEIVTSNPSNGINLTTNTGNLWGVLLNTNSNDFPVGKLALKFGSNETASITARSNEMRIGGSQMNITFYTSSSEKFRVDTNGNVGIGTTSPSTKLHVQGAASGYLFRVQGTSTLNVYDPGAAAEIGVGSGSGDKLKLFSNDSLNNGITIDTSGSVGIGTTSPAYILDVVSAGSATARLKSAGTGAISLRYENGSGFKSAAVVDNNGLYRLDATNISLNPTNNVGIGTTSPSRNLHVHADSGNAYLQLTQAVTGTTSNDGFQISMGTAQVNFINRENGNMVFETNNTEKMRITNTGNVGIGTTSPAHKLTINALNDTTAVGIDFPSAHFDFAANSTSGYNTLFKMDNTGLDIGHDSTARSLNLKTGNLDRVTILGNGNVGIGTTSPNEKLHVTGYAKADTGFKAGNYTILNESGNETSLSNTAYYPMFFKTNNSTRMTISNAGNVGIGTTSPGAKLSVNGNVKIEGTNSLLFGGSASIPSWAINHNGSDLLIDDQGGNIGSVLFNNDEGVALPRLTTTEINAISLPAQGLMAYNTTLNTICFYNGSSWQKVSHTSM